MDTEYRPPAKLMRVEIWSRCNYSCRFCCWQRDDAAKPALMFTPGQIQSLCRALVATGCHNVNLTGGEPLLAPMGYLCETIAAIRDVAGINRLWATTNGSTLRAPGVCERLAAAGLTELAVSVASETDQGYRAYTDTSVTLTQILRGVEIAQTHGISVRLHVPLCRAGIQTFEQLETLLDKAAAAGVTEAFYFGLHNSESLAGDFDAQYVDPGAITEGFTRSDRWCFGETETGRPYFSDGFMRVDVPRPMIRLVTDTCKANNCGALCQGIYSAYCVPGSDGWVLRACNRIFNSHENEFALPPDLLEHGRELELAHLLKSVWGYAYEQ